ncbi:uncharacterized protein E6C27_scaffold409G00010 [Cucumis melo var. makuwa]|uniref:DUF4218 domain-containing protein n=1 Tax=Cucumis melo var. makuwa TaxID=1194695 RepID=A0A5A7UT16_CUCMM|nr:uncharacterized protein E6C27_scaffold409G00010 [Cucumis melo var. makuwa]
MRLCSMFNTLCQRVIDREKLVEIEHAIVETLCLLEKFFPPSFFDIMVHLLIHLGRKARLCGPVQFRWMYPFERYMKVLKAYVRNRARLEGCITKELKNSVILEGRPISAGISITMDDDDLKNAHRYVLFNTTEIEPFVEYVFKIETDSSNTNESKLVKWLANEPRKSAVSYTGFVVNGHVKSIEKSTQNNGISLQAKTLCRSSCRDEAEVVDMVSYYGVLTQIILLDYYVHQIPLFRCDWVNVSNGVRVEDGFTPVNLHQSQHQFSKESFILASQAKQVFYSRENETSNWYVVLKAPPRRFHDLEIYDEEYDAFISERRNNTVAKRCLHFDSKAPRKRRSKKSLKSPSRGLQRTENDDSVKASEKEGATLTIPETEPPNDGDNLDGTHTTPSSPVPFDSPASRVGEDLNEAKPNHTTPSSPVPTQLPKKRRGPTKMKTLATEECDKVNITFNKFGQPIGEASVGLSSFLGPLVREVVPMTLNDWRKLSTRYKEILWTSIQAESAKFKSMKKRQLPHTCSRKGYARLAEDMKKNSTDSSSVTRVALWTKAHRKKDGTPVNSEVAEILGNGSDQLSNVTNDQVVNNVATNPIGNSPPSINNNNTLRKCTLLDCGGVGEVVAKGRWSSNDPNVTVHHVPLGPHVVRVWVDLPKKSDAFLWRPNSEMTYIEDAVGSTVAWHLDKVILS